MALARLHDDENGDATAINVYEGNAHGTAFDRVGAFETGFIGGAVACMALAYSAGRAIKTRASNGSVRRTTSRDSSSPQRTRHGGRT